MEMCKAAFRTLCRAPADAGPEIVMLNVSFGGVWSSDPTL